jgi:hypothetical protein
MFNKFFSAFVKDLKTMDDSLKTVIKKNFKVIDKSSEEYFNLFWSNVQPKFDTFVQLSSGDITDDTRDKSYEEIGSVEVVKDITIKSVLDVISESNVDAFWNYMNTLIVFAYLYNEAKKESTSNRETNGEDTGDKSPASALYLLFVKVVKILSMIQKGEDASNDMTDILDDDVKALLSGIHVQSFTQANEEVKIDETADVLPTPTLEFLKNIENSKIADLAKEISKDIDVSSLNLEKPEDIAKLMDFSGSNNFLGNIVSKVSSKLTEKISTGEIKQEDLMTEAMSMMSMLNGGGAGGGLADMLIGMSGLGGLGGLDGLMNNPMMSEMMKMAKKGNVQTKNSHGSRKGASSTRDRLRKKLDERKKPQEDTSS